ncbi:hypothetical protein AYO37_00110 [Opitutia bacterium SCGC AG-212-L18]|nr:hypothetical protein AYO37_00110 [Opitutae bacterium SCGC AG-212-L18]
MKWLKTTLFFILLSTSINVYAKEKVERINQDLLEYSFPVLFEGLPERLAEFTPYFQAIAFVIIVASLGFAFLNANEPRSYLSAVVFAGVLSAVIASSGLFVQLGLDTVYSLNKALNVDSPYAIAHRLYNAGMHFQEPRIQEGNSDLEMDKMAMAMTSPDDKPEDEKKGNRMVRFFKNPVACINHGLKSLVVLFIAMIIHLLLYVCALFMICVETFRYFLIRCGALILPVFIAGLMTKNFRAQSITYIFSLIGVVCWPIGWSLGHIGTVALYDSILQIINGALITDSRAASNIIEDLSTVDNAFDHVTRVASWVGVVSIGSLISIFGMFVGIVLWVLLVTLSAPYLIQRCISSGAQFFSGLVGGAAQATSRAMGGGASYVMVRSARSMAMGENGERPQPSPGMRAAFALSRTMMNASRFQGDPGQFSQIGDTGIDELRQYRAEAAQVDTARAAVSKKVPKDEEKSMRAVSKKAYDKVKGGR